MADKKILVVEDNAIIAMETIERLKRLGYLVCGVAPTGAEAIRIAESASPDLVLMDINLRGEMDGIEAAEAIYRKRPVPIIYLTAYSDDETLARAQKVRPSRYLVKPYKEVDLYASIEEALRSEPAGADPQVSPEMQRFADRLDACGDGIIVVGTDGAIRYLNPKAQEITGWTTGAASGRPVGEILSGPDGTEAAGTDHGTSQPCTIITPVGTAVHARVTWIRAGGEGLTDGPAFAMIWTEGKGRQ